MLQSKEKKHPDISQESNRLNTSRTSDNADKPRIAPNSETKINFF